MESKELVVWATLLGGLLILSSVGIYEATRTRTSASLRSAVSVVLTSAACIVLSGLPEALWPELPQRLGMVLKVSVGPLGAAVSLNYLGAWLGGVREDPLVHRLTVWGSAVIMVSAVALALLAFDATPQEFSQLLTVTAALHFSATLAGFAAVKRATSLGDPLAGWMVVGCTALGVGVFGLYLRATEVPGFGLGTWMLTVACLLSYQFIATALVMSRNRDYRRQKRLAGLTVGMDAATGLPTGSVLLSKVAHAFWRTSRLHRQHCIVACMYLRNLYELSDAAGHGVENQILTALAARIRRTVGFRCVVGLYHPRCFVVVVSADRNKPLDTMSVARLQFMINKPVSVVGRDNLWHEFVPEVGFGMITLNPSFADAAEVLSDAERQAQNAPQPDTQEFVDTVP